MLSKRTSLSMAIGAAAVIALAALWLPSGAASKVTSKPVTEAQPITTVNARLAAVAKASQNQASLQSKAASTAAAVENLDWAEDESLSFPYFNDAEDHQLETDKITISKWSADELAALLDAVEVEWVDGSAEQPDQAAVLRIKNADNQSLRQLVRTHMPSAYVAPVFTGTYDGAWWSFHNTVTVQVDADVDIAAVIKEAGLDDSVASIQRNTFGQADFANLQIASQEGKEVLAVANVLSKTKGIRIAEPRMFGSGKHCFTPSDPLYRNQWGLHQRNDIDIDAPEAWNISRGTSAVGVMVIDTGIDSSHRDLRVYRGRDFVTTDGESRGNPYNRWDNHGTWVAGVINGQFNRIGVAGIAPYCRLFSARCFRTTNSRGSWSANYDWTAQALYWAASQGVRVSNNSNSYGGRSAVVEAAYANTRLYDRMVHFASAGNDSRTNYLSYPSRLSTVISVGAITSTGARASFSNRSSQLDFCAPGQGIWTTDRRGSAGRSGDYASVSGTSFSAPAAAGVAALVLSYQPNATADRVMEVLANSVRDLGSRGRDSSYGRGLVKANRALVVSRSIRYARFHRYWNSRIGDHFYTTNWGELGRGRNGYRYEGVACYLLNAAPRGARVGALHRYWNPRIGDHFYTTNWSELGRGRNGYRYEGVAGYVYTRYQRGTVPLYRYWNSRIGDHFYTTNWSELGRGRHGYRYEGVAGYVVRSSQPRSIN